MNDVTTRRDLFSRSSSNGIGALLALFGLDLQDGEYNLGRTAT